MARQHEATSKRLFGNTLVGLGIGSLAVGLSILSGEQFASSAPALPFLFVAILLASWFGQTAGGLTATLLVFLGYWLYVSPPKWAFNLGEWQEASLLSFALACVTVNIFNLWRRHAEHQLKETRDRLAMARDGTAKLLWETRRTRRELQSMNQQLSVAIQHKDEFVGMVSHELRSPVTTLLGGTKLLRHRELAAADREDLLETMEHDAFRLQSMIENLLALARADGGQPRELGPVLLQRTIPGLIEDFKQRSGREGLVAFVADACLPAVEANEWYIERVLDNLLGNADKYSPSDRPIAVLAQVEGDEAVVTVKDSGPGVLPEELPLIFERFYRSGRTSSARGTGLGLAVCRRLVEGLGGRIWAELPPEGGLSVRFSLPLVGEEALVPEVAPVARGAR